MASMRSSIAILCLVAPACIWCLVTDPDEDESSVLLLQTNLSPSPTALANVPPHNLAEAGQAQALTQTTQMLEAMETYIKTGFWAQQAAPMNGCGQASFHELGMTIPEWRKQHPTEDGFCYFQNYAAWFIGAGENYSEYKTVGWRTTMGARVSSFLCGNIYNGESRGPEWLVHNANHLVEEGHMDSCIDTVDDPYCYSLGWLKGQRLDQTNISNGNEWRAKAVSECQRIQETFQFIDEEVTVGAHVMGTPVYLAKSVANALGRGPPIEERIHNRHVYTKCQLGFGGAPSEMAYCYYKGCVMADGKISHGAECGYHL